jgi:hypothetical protein
MATGPQSNPGFKGPEGAEEGKGENSGCGSDIYYSDRYFTGLKRHMVTDGSRGSTMTAAVEETVQARAAPGCWGTEPFAMPPRCGTTADFSPSLSALGQLGTLGGANKPNVEIHIHPPTKTLTSPRRQQTQPRDGATSTLQFALGPAGS